MKKLFRVVSLTIIAVFLFCAAASASVIAPPDNGGQQLKQDVERVDFIHKVKKPKTKAAKTGAGYKLMGVKWNSFPVACVINPNNDEGLSTADIEDAISASTDAWDNETSKNLFAGTFTVDRNVVHGVYDDNNSIVFGTYPDNNVIAVTSIWYIRQTKQIVEFDILFNSKFVWGDAKVNPSVMDLQNIATHELGHGVGLSDIYSTAYDYVTMYGYSSEGDTEKRTLARPDINGLQKIYGN
jgi:hypothetical protein